MTRVVLQIAEARITQSRETLTMIDPVLTMGEQDIVERCFLPEFVEWCREHFGPPGIRWSVIRVSRPKFSFYRDSRTLDIDDGDIEFEFTDEADAVLFKLRWG